MQTETQTEASTAVQQVEAPTVQSEAAVLIDAQSGNMLYALQPDESLYPASITKIVTGIIALETTEPDEIVTVSKEARYEDGTRIYLAEGEQVTMEKLLYGLLMNSGNDAATAIAEHIDGSKEKFAERMNQFVREKIGVTHTTFKNPSGLPDPEHVTTASDMAKIARYAMQNETFRKIVSTKTMPWNGKEWQSELVNHNRMLWNYEGATGMKNGYTEAAGNTLVISATRGDMDLIAVVLKAPSADAAYSDTTKLLDYGFDNFHMQTLVSSGETFTVEDGEDTVEWQAANAIATAVPNGERPAPAVTVSKDGEVLVDGKYGAQTLGQLHELSRTNHAEAENAAKGEVQALAAGASGDTAAGSGGSSPLLWPTLAILAALAGWFGYRVRKRRERM
ncbi:D-alanyl-D-alanine carboxypeptidase [Cohnella lubricantis]|uniref:D-alanyl-D-alanine carboxypeptidase n=2 Tax=Cohnella lubricantis TaxID=2163172 RepID=A0A841TD14_9BACL|nr:D-alanyl-D-alanine carboxypeptidase [Cohnella lubricantis]